MKNGSRAVGYAISASLMLIPVGKLEKQIDEQKPSLFVSQHPINALPPKLPLILLNPPTADPYSPNFAVADSAVPTKIKKPGYMSLRQHNNLAVFNSNCRYGHRSQSKFF